MGGIGYITAYLADISRNNILINAHMLEASKQNAAKRFLFSSSACVYAQNKQKSADVIPLREEDAYPAEPEPGYGWEKLFTEELCRYYVTIMDSRPAQCVSTMFTAHLARTTAGRKKLQPPFPVRSR